MERQEVISPLRCTLARHLFQELLNRLDTIANHAQDHKTIQALIQQQALRTQMEWPYLRWNPQKQIMEHSHRKPMSMKNAHQTVEQLIELLPDDSTIQKFQALRTTTPTKDIPWLLQVGLRNDSAWTLLDNLNQSALWMILGVNCKQYSQPQSRQAEQLLQAVFPTRTPKGKGKGKSTGQKGK